MEINSDGIKIDVKVIIFLTSLYPKAFNIEATAKEEFNKSNAIVIIDKIDIIVMIDIIIINKELVKKDVLSKSCIYIDFEFTL